MKFINKFKLKKIAQTFLACLMVVLVLSLTIIPCFASNGQFIDETYDFQMTGYEGQQMNGYKTQTIALTGTSASNNNNTIDWVYYYDNLVANTYTVRNQYNGRYYWLEVGGNGDSALQRFSLYTLLQDYINPTNIYCSAWYSASTVGFTLQLGVDYYDINGNFVERYTQSYALTTSEATYNLDVPNPSGQVKYARVTIGFYNDGDTTTNAVGTICIKGFGFDYQIPTNADYYDGYQQGFQDGYGAGYSDGLNNSTQTNNGTGIDFPQANENNFILQLKENVVRLPVTAFGSTDKTNPIGICCVSPTSTDYTNLNFIGVRSIIPNEQDVAYYGNGLAVRTVDTHTYYGTYKKLGAVVYSDNSTLTNHTVEGEHLQFLLLNCGDTITATTLMYYYNGDWYIAPNYESYITVSQTDGDGYKYQQVAGLIFDYPNYTDLEWSFVMLNGYTTKPTNMSEQATQLFYTFQQINTYNKVSTDTANTIARNEGFDTGANTNLWVSLISSPIIAFFSIPLAQIMVDGAVVTITYGILISAGLVVLIFIWLLKLFAGG